MSRKCVNRCKCKDFYASDCVRCAKLYIEEDHDDGPDDILRYAAQESACDVIKCMITEYGATPMGDPIDAAADGRALRALLDNGGVLTGTEQPKSEELRNIMGQYWKQRLPQIISNFF